MAFLSTDFPDFRRADAGTALVSPWIAPEPALQRATADAVLAEWEQQSRPEALLSLSVFLSTDGSHLLNYAQWTSDDAHRAWARTRRPALVDRIDEGLPGIRRPGLVRYRRYRSYTATGHPATPRPASLLVTPAFTTTGPDAQRALADTVVDALTRDPAPGLIGAHFHLSQDGTRVVNLAEWEDLPAWQEFAARGAAEPMAERIAALEGVTPAAQAAPGAEMPGVRRYRLYKCLVNRPAPDAAGAPRTGAGSTGPGRPAPHGGD